MDQDPPDLRNPRDTIPMPASPAAMTHPIQALQPSPEVRALLSASQLPTSDLGDGATVRLFGCMADQHPCGVVGLEIHGEVALLRSLAVADAQRGGGLGAALVAHAERYAAGRGVATVYLLTTTAAGFFMRLGYRHVPREDAPAAIAATSQFSGLCPASSAFMAKSVGGERGADRVDSIPGGAGQGAG
jgi:amino-acid N-acetyltransferase